MLLRPALEETAAVGHCLVRGVLASERIPALLAELLPRAFSPLEPRVGTVDQRGEGFTLRLDAAGTVVSPDVAFPVVEQLASDLTAEVRASGIPGTADYIPNEATCQRYLDEASGISPHMDQRRYRLLVAVYTLEGQATFTVYENRSATTVVDTWETGSGDLCLLRAPGLAHHLDGRPTHSVAGPVCGARVSLTLRVNERAWPVGGASLLEPTREG